jgi:cytochrome c551/c552
MKRKIVFGVVLMAGLVMAACGGNDSASGEANTSSATSENTSNQAADDGKGVGKFTNVELTNPLDQKMVSAGKLVYDMKCGSCHRLTNEKLVGPGWKGVTSRRKPEWIMNFATNVEEMLAKDPNAMAMLEECLVRMPNQNLSDDDARHVLEFMRNNDGVK